MFGMILAPTVSLMVEGFTKIPRYLPSSPNKEKAISFRSPGMYARPTVSMCCALQHFLLRNVSQQPGHGTIVSALARCVRDDKQLIIKGLLLSTQHPRSRSFLTLSVPQVGRIETMLVPMPTDLPGFRKQEAKKSRVKQLTGGGFL